MLEALKDKVFHANLGEARIGYLHMGQCIGH
jgi:hypothetical protein